MHPVCQITQLHCTNVISKTGGWSWATILCRPVVDHIGVVGNFLWFYNDFQICVFVFWLRQLSFSFTSWQHLLCGQHHVWGSLLPMVELLHVQLMARKSWSPHEHCCCENTLIVCCSQKECNCCSGKPMLGCLATSTQLSEVTELATIDTQHHLWRYTTSLGEEPGRYMKSCCHH